MSDKVDKVDGGFSKGYEFAYGCPWRLFWPGGSSLPILVDREGCTIVLSVKGGVKLHALSNISSQLNNIENQLEYIYKSMRG